MCQFLIYDYTSDLILFYSEGTRKLTFIDGIFDQNSVWCSKSRVHLWRSRKKNLRNKTQFPNLSLSCALFSICIYIYFYH